MAALGLGAVAVPRALATGQGSAATGAGGRQQSHYRIRVFARTTEYRHDAIPDAVAALRALGGEHGFDVDHTEAPGDPYGCQPAVVPGDCLPADDRRRARPQQQAEIERFIRAGGGYVGVHSACDTEYEWPWYGQLVGAYFQHHPEIQAATVHVEDGTHPSTVGLPARWERTDEWYYFRANPRETVRVLLRLDETTYRGGQMGADHPIAWYHEFDGGRAWYTAGGHTAESYREPLFLQHLLGGIEYAAGQVAAVRPVRSMGET